MRKTGWSRTALATVCAVCSVTPACDATTAPSSSATAEPVVAASATGARAPAPARPPDAPSASSDRGGAPSGGGAPNTLAQIKTVFLILMENKAWSEVKGSPDAPYLNKVLLPQASLAAQYRSPRAGGLHPSEPNYIWLEAGDNLGITDDENPRANHVAARDHLVNQLEAAGVSWRAYEEDIPGDSCPLARVGAYVPKHDPMVFFDDVTNGNDPAAPRCVEHIRPLVKTPSAGGDFESDLASGKVGRYNFITPNMCNDMHTSCPPLDNTTKQGDEWLARWIPKIMASVAYRDSGAIFVTWDESEYAADCPSADCPIGMFVVSPLAKGGGYTGVVAYDHSSTLRSLQEIFHVSPFLRAAANATDLSDLFKPAP